MSKKGLLVGVFLLLAALLGFYLWNYYLAAPLALTSEEGEWLAAKGSLTLAGPQDYPPFQYLEEGVYKGFNVDLMAELGMALNCGIRLMAMGQEEALVALDAGEVDAVLGVVRSPENEGLYDLSRPYLSTAISLFVPTDRFDLRGIEDLEGERVAVVKGSPAQGVLEGRGGVLLVVVEGVEQALGALQGGQVSAFVGEEKEGLYTLGRLGLGEEIKVVGEPLAHLDYSLAVKKENSPLPSILDYGLAALEEMGVRGEVERRWFGLPALEPRASLAPQVTMALTAVVILLLVGLGAFLWNRSLRKEVEQKRRELWEWRDRYRKLLSSTDDAILTINPADGGLLEANRQAEVLTGYLKDELLTMGLDRLLSLKDRRRALEGLQGALLAGSGGLEDLSLLRQDGVSISVDLSANVVAYDGRKVIQCTLRDVTERKEMRRQLLERTEDLLAINAVAAMVSRFVDLEEVLNEVLGKVLALMKMEAGIIFLLGEEGRLSPVVQRGLEEGVEVAAEEALGTAKEVVERGEALMASDLVADPHLVGMRVRRGGWGSLASVPLKSKEKVQGVMNIYGRSIHLFDLGDKDLLETVGNQIGVAIENAFLFQRLRRTVGELSAVKRFNESVLQNMTNGLLVVDTDGRVSLANRAAEEILGYGEGELIEKGFREVLGQGASVVQEGLERGVVARGEAEVAKRGGGKVPLALSVSPLRGEGGGTSGVVVVMSDLSEAKRMEEERRRLDRLALLGEMSAVVAHEIRNPLAGIGAGIQHIASKVREGDAIYESIEMVMRESERVNRIIEDILMVSRPVRLKVGPCDVVEVVEELLERYEGRMNTQKIRVKKYYGATVPVIMGDGMKISQALGNLILNGIEAMPKGGELRVAVRGRDGQVEVEVKDSGEGIKEEDKERLFEPFWSTKPGGTGLGLAIAQRIIEEHKGEIRVESKEGEGTTFLVCLPVQR